MTQCDLDWMRRMPTTRSLERFAEATGTKLRINFVPEQKSCRKSR